MLNKNILNKLSQHQFWLIPIFILVASFSIRFVYLNQIQHIPTFNHPVMDEKYHVDLAEKINAGIDSPDEPFYRAPLYPHFLAILFKITDNSLYASRLIQNILGSFLAVLIYLLALKLFNRKIAFWSAVIAVFYPTFLYFDSTLLITSLMILLSALLIWQLYRCQEGSYRQFFYTGILLGLAGLARPNILLLGPALIIWIWLIIKPRIGWKKAIINYIIIGLTAFIVILPITIRNYAVSHEFVLIAWQGGYNFFIGNNHQASGWSATVPGINKSWEGGYTQAIAFTEQTEGKKLKYSEVSDFWYHQTWQEIRNYPATFIKLLFKKIRLLFNGYEIPNNQNIYLARQFAPLIKPLLFNKLIYFPFGLLAPLALMGLVLSLKQWRKYLLVYLFLISYAISFLLFFVCARYRQPMIPFFILFGVYAVYRFIDFLKRKKIKNVILFLFIFLLLAVESNHNILGIKPKRVKAEDYLMIGNAYLKENNLAAAYMEYKKSVIADSTFARGYNNLGLIDTRRQKYATAAKYFQKAIQFNPEVVESYINYATTFILKRDYKTALKILENTRQRFPLNDYVALKLGMTYFEAGQIDSAKTAIENCLQLNPKNETAKQVYQEILKQLSHKK